MRMNVWYIDPDEGISYHAHSEQEELLYVAEGTFSLKLGRSGETEAVEAGPGTWWAAGPPGRWSATVIGMSATTRVWYSRLGRSPSMTRA